METDRYEGRSEVYVINGGTLNSLRYRDEILDPIAGPFDVAIVDFHSDAG